MCRVRRVASWDVSWRAATGLCGYRLFRTFWDCRRSVDIRYSPCHLYNSIYYIILYYTDVHVCLSIVLDLQSLPVRPRPWSRGYRDRAEVVGTYVTVTLQTVALWWCSELCCSNDNECEYITIQLCLQNASSAESCHAHYMQYQLSRHHLNSLQRQHQNYEY